MSQNVALKPSVQIKVSDTICGKTESYLGLIAQWGGRTSDDTAMRNHSLGTTCSERKRWVRDGSCMHAKILLHLAGGASVQLTTKALHSL